METLSKIESLKLDEEEIKIGHLVLDERPLDESSTGGESTDVRSREDPDLGSRGPDNRERRGS